MIEFLKRNNTKSLVLFVHGFTGDKMTWQNSNTRTFPELLLMNERIKEKFDIAYFIYYTKLLNLFSKTGNVSKIIKRLFKTSHEKLKKNTSVEEISNILRTEIRYRLQEYDNIIIIAHSMGGVVAKSCIVKDIQEQIPSKIRLFISLSVPHMGVNLATFGSLVSGNLQIGDLTPLNEFIHHINDVWLKTSLRPETKYFYGIHDSIVPKTSACPIDKEINDVISVDENHNSISKPEGRDSTLYIAVENIILSYLDTDPAISGFEIQTLTDESEYKDELFVLKLIIADVHNSTIRDAKEVFLNAEYARKIFSSESDQRRLSELYNKVRKIYKDSYTKYLHGGHENSGLLVADVHEKIINEDKEFLHTLIPFMSAIHKQGMLHQLANDKDKDIWWTKDQGMELLEKIIQDLK